MSEPIPSAKQFEEAAFAFVVIFIAIALCAIIDGFDGVTSSKYGTYRLADDPDGFRSHLILRWSWYAVCAAIAAIASGIGALVLKARKR